MVITETKQTLDWVATDEAVAIAGITKAACDYAYEMQERLSTTEKLEAFVAEIVAKQTENYYRLKKFMEGGGE